MPSSPGYKRDLKREYETQKMRGEVGTGSDSDNAKRKRARRKALKMGLIKPSQDLAHKKALSKGGSNDPSNWKGEAPGPNRSFARNSDGSMKSEVSKRERK